MPDNNAPENSTLPSSSSLLPFGLGLTATGWSTVLTYPSINNPWALWQSPNSQYWGPSNSLRATLEVGGSPIFEIPGVPQGALTYAEGFARGLSPAQVNNFNGNVAAVQTNELMLTTPRSINYGGQSFYVNNQLFTQIDGVVSNYSPLGGLTISNPESKLGFSNTVDQALFDRRFFAIPTTMAEELGIPGVLSNNGRTTLVTSAAADGIAEMRYTGLVTTGTGLILTGVGVGFAGWNQ
jgi:hypothetical protein